MGLDIFHVIPSKKTDHTIDYFTLDEFLYNPTFIQKYSHLIEDLEIIDDDNNPIIIKVLYYIEKGYQRKNMNYQFCKDFINDFLYFDLSTVQKATQYLEPSWGDSLEELQQSFKESFIDNFIEGESVFYANW